jgi:hypothetical protein
VVYASRAHAHAKHRVAVLLPSRCVTATTCIPSCGLTTRRFPAHHAGRLLGAGSFGRVYKGAAGFMRFRVCQQRALLVAESTKRTFSQRVAMPHSARRFHQCHPSDAVLHVPCRDVTVSLSTCDVVVSRAVSRAQVAGLGARSRSSASSTTARRARPSRMKCSSCWQWITPTYVWHQGN